MKAVQRNQLALRPRRRTLGGSLVLGVLTTVALELSTPAVHADPRHPTDTQISQAQQARARQAVQVDRLAAALATQQEQTQRLAEAAAQAAELYDKTRADLHAATAWAQQAQAAAQAAQQQVDAARQQLRRLARASYVQASLAGPAGALLVPGGPPAAAQRLDYLSLVLRHRCVQLAQAVRAKSARANAASAARADVFAREDAADAAAQAKATTALRLTQARHRLARLRQQTTATRRQLAQTQKRLRDLLAERGGPHREGHQPPDIRQQTDTPPGHSHPPPATPAPGQRPARQRRAGIVGRRELPSAGRLSIPWQGEWRSPASPTPR